MVSRTLDILVAHHELNKAKSLIGQLQKTPGELGDVRTTYDVFQYSDQAEADAQKIVKRSNDVVLMYLTDVRKGRDLARKVKELKPGMPLIGLYVRPGQRDRLFGFMSQDDLFQDIWQHSYNKSEVEALSERIRALAWKPIDVGVMGFGDFGIPLAAELLDSPDVKSVHGYSERTPAEHVLHILERREDDPKLKFHDELGAMAEKSDVIVLTSSELRMREVREMGLNRKDLFRYNVPKFRRYFEMIRETSFEGLLTVFSNPIGATLELARRSGMQHGQLTSPFELDVWRVTHYLDQQARTGRQKEFVEDAKKHLVVGMHGGPKVAIPVSYSQVVRYGKNGFRYHVDEAENLAARLGDLSQQSSYDHQTTVVVPQRAPMPFFENIAHYRESPDTTAYCFAQAKIGDETVSGFTAMPVLLHYDPLTVRQDRDAIEEIDFDRLFFHKDGPRLACRLKSQMKFVDDVLAVQ